MHHSYGPNSGRPYRNNYDDGYHSNYHHSDNRHHYRGNYHQGHHDGYGPRGRNEDMMNFSLNYRHLAENNPENYKMLMCINMKVADRRGIRLMIFENDNIRELGSRLMHYLWTN